MKAFITLLSTEDYLDAVLVLNRSFKEVESKYPFICGVTESLKDNYEVISQLQRAGIKIEIIKNLEYSQAVKDKWPNHTVLNTASKISLFELTQYEKLVYIDADTMLLENIDDVMDYPDGSMIGPAPSEKGDEYGFTGMFVFIPKYHRVDFYKCLLANFPCADGDMLGSLWFFTRTSPIHRIPYAYCMHYTYYIHEDNKAKVIHFCNEQKPWKPQYQDYFKNNSDPAIQKYREYMKQIHPGKGDFISNTPYCSAVNFTR